MTVARVERSELADRLANEALEGSWVALNSLLWQACVPVAKHGDSWEFRATETHIELRRCGKEAP